MAAEGGKGAQHIAPYQRLAVGKAASQLMEHLRLGELQQAVSVATQFSHALVDKAQWSQNTQDEAKA